MSGLDSLAVDLDLLDDTVAEMVRSGEALDALLDEVSRRVAALHLTWAGAAAHGQERAQCDWEAGFTEMRGALSSMRRAGRSAHTSYREAADTNLRMWDQVS